MISAASDSFNNSHNLLLVNKPLVADKSYPNFPHFNNSQTSADTSKNDMLPTSSPSLSDNNSLHNDRLQQQQQHTQRRRTICSQCLDQFFEKVESIYQNDGIDYVPRGFKNSLHDHNSRRNINNDQNEEITVADGDSYKQLPRPKISINVIDAENLSVCMCSLYNSRNNSDDNLLRQRDANGVITTTTIDDDGGVTEETNKICPICRNIIKKQPIERRTLISKRLLLANDIIVNRIDSHFLNTFSGINLKQDPYTPESPDSFSPVLESESSSSNRDESDRITSEDIEISLPLNADGGGGVSHHRGVNHGGANNNNISGASTRQSGGVSPRQLKSRLERLRRMSENSDSEKPATNQRDFDETGKLDSKNTDCCTGTRCSIL